METPDILPPSGDSKTEESLPHPPAAYTDDYGHIQSSVHVSPGMRALDFIHMAGHFTILIYRKF
jgi:hypothetical protein